MSIDKLLKEHALVVVSADMVEKGLLNSCECGDRKALLAKLAGVFRTGLDSVAGMNGAEFCPMGL